jgi:hypothetical protein
MACKPVEYMRGRHRSGDAIALSLRDTQRVNPASYRDVFDSLGDHGQSQLLREPGKCLDDDLTRVVLRDIDDEALVDLQLIEGHAMEEAQVRQSGAKIVEA